MQVLQNDIFDINSQKNIKMNMIVSNATIIFSRQGIHNTKMTDIAEVSNIGVATLYRYFKTKGEIVIQSGIYVWKSVEEILKDKINNKVYQDKSGFDQINYMTDLFLKAYDTNTEFFRFLYYFDDFILKEDIGKERLLDYEASILSIKNIVIKALEKGQQDNTIKQSINCDEFYMVSMHSLIKLCQKLIMENDILEMDISVSDKKQIQILIDMILFYIKNN